jgi:hypothetical protein
MAPGVLLALCQSGNQLIVMQNAAHWPRTKLKGSKNKMKAKEMEDSIVKEAQPANGRLQRTPGGAGVEHKR